MQKELEEKQKILESLTQGKENLNAILGSKINLNKEGIRFLLKTKKKYDVKTISFVPQQTTKTNPLIKMNCLIAKNLTQISKEKISQNEKGKEKVGENKSSQIKSEKNLKNIKLGLNKNQTKSLKNNINKAGRLSTYHTSTQWKQNAHTGRRSLTNASTHNNTNALGS